MTGTNKYSNVYQYFQTFSVIMHTNLYTRDKSQQTTIFGKMIFIFYQGVIKECARFHEDELLNCAQFIKLINTMKWKAYFLIPMVTRSISVRYCYMLARHGLCGWCRNCLLFSWAQHVGWYCKTCAGFGASFCHLQKENLLSNNELDESRLSLWFTWKLYADHSKENSLHNFH
jgi:hypothetical protein